MPQATTRTSNSSGRKSASSTRSMVKGWSWPRQMAACACVVMISIQRLDGAELHAAVYHHVGAGHVAARVRSQEQRKRLDLVSLGHPPDRHELVPRGLGGRVLLDPAVADVGHERPRRDRVDADAVSRQLVSGV